MTEIPAAYKSKLTGIPMTSVRSIVRTAVLLFLLIVSVKGNKKPIKPSKARGSVPSIVVIPGIGMLHKGGVVVIALNGTGTMFPSPVKKVMVPSMVLPVNSQFGQIFRLMVADKIASPSNGIKGSNSPLATPVTEQRQLFITSGKIEGHCSGNWPTGGQGKGSILGGMGARGLQKSAMISNFTSDST